MIAYLDGIVVSVSESRVILDVNHIGFQVFISSRDASAMPRRGESVTLFTYMNVKEDAMQLYGFLDEDDLEMFKLLLTVNGIGPKAALGVCSALTADDIRFAVLSDDVKTISKAPGIGAKTAKKMILELKDKMNLEDTFEKKLEHTSQQASVSNVLDGAKSEAVQALTALGYSASDAWKAVRKVELQDEMDVETILKLALKQMAFL